MVGSVAVSGNMKLNNDLGKYGFFPRFFFSVLFLFSLTETSSWERSKLGLSGNGKEGKTKFR